MMKTKIQLRFLLLMALVLFFPHSGRAQSIAQCLQQLALDYQKLSGLKNILKQMYTGYSVLRKGYGEVISVSHGNFSLHQAFLDGLLIASPAVRAYPKVSDIIDMQSELMSEYGSAWSTFRQDKHFGPDELSYLLSVYNNLITQSLKSLSDLALVLSDNQLRMSDAERLLAIDRIFESSQGQLTFLRSFNDHNYRLASSRAEAEADRQTTRSLYQIN